jgi:NAD(P)-dependent dehydrogenase (short-subunit alcohol dehydrogenase family)
MNPNARRRQVLLEDRNAVIHGGGGAIGGAVAKGFAREGARVFLAGRTREALERTAEEIRAAGGAASFCLVDALDERAVEDHARAVAAAGGSIDICFNAVSIEDVQGTPMHEMPVDDYLAPVVNAVRSAKITWSAAVRHMPRGGVIIAFGGEGHPPRGHHLGGLQTAFHAVEAMRRQLSVELGERGVRVVTLRTGGVPETIDDPGRRARIEQGLREATLTGHAATLEDVARTAVFAASSPSMTGATLNVSAGALLD